MVLKLVLGTIATWRLSYFLIHEDGPFDVTLWIRTIFGRVPVFDKMLSCIYCLSFWVGISFTVIIFSDYWFIAVPFVFSAGAIFLDTIRGWFFFGQRKRD